MTTPLIDREIFFGNPTIMGAKISPDGAFITFVKPYRGMLNIWIKKTSESFENALPLTNDTTRPITGYFWSRDSKYVLYVQDAGGDENYHVYSVDPHLAFGTDEIPTAKDLSNYKGIRAMILGLPKTDHDIIFVGINDRDPAWHDLYKISISTGERELIIINDFDANSFYFNLKDELCLASKATNEAGVELLSLQSDGLWKSIVKTSGDEYCHPVKGTSDGQYYIESNVGEEDLSFLGILNLEDATVVQIEEDPEGEVDFGAAIFSGQTNELIATSYVGDKPRIYWKDQAFEADYNFLKNHFGDVEVSFISGTKDERKWIIAANSDIDPGSTHFFDRDTQEVSFLYRPRPDLPSEHLCKMKAIKYVSYDGTVIPAYLTLPKNEENIAGAIILPHGGPWVRDAWGYNSYAQFLANRGYAVLQSNYRGSTGYGKEHLNAGDREWGRKMQDDLTAGVDFIINKRICNKDKVGILGGSYGGYATLAGLAFTPDVYTCGVSIVGPSNLFTLLESIPAYWESARAMFHKRMGDPSTEEGRALLTARSPFFHADKIKAPLLVAQGNNDPRVKTAESDQIVFAMRQHGLDVEYLNFPDEGHGFANPTNSMAFIAVMEAFLAKHIGGRSQKEIPEKLQEIIDKVSVDVDKIKL